MGVQGLWSLLAPCARPVDIATLNRKRLAIDASIWIYQFLKAVRDKEGNALRNSHIVGFFRRICKLLFHGILPVFIFDGAAPQLKRMTLEGRRRRREGRRDDAVRTAGKLLAVQMQRRLEEEEANRKRQIEVRGSVMQEEESEVIPDNLVYVDEIDQSAQQRAQNRTFRKTDAYHLPELSGSIEGMGKPDDPRIMSSEELEEYARQFNSGEDINLYDFSKIDFDGEFFQSLPPGDRYNILNAARLRSRMRMGLGKEQLEEMFPNRMDFSRFQIERVQERNQLTQRLMNLNGMNDMPGVSNGGRIAGQSSREYVLVKNDGVEGGWALGVVSTDKSVGDRNKPIDIDEMTVKRQAALQQAQESSEEDDFEDVPIEGLNRLPKSKQRLEDLESAEFVSRQRKDYYASRKSNERPVLNNQESIGDEDSLFVGQVPHPIGADVDRQGVDSEEEELHRAIAMSLQQHHKPASEDEEEDAEFEDVPPPSYQQRVVQEHNPFSESRGRGVAHIVNKTANASVPKRRAASISSDEDDLQAVLAKSRKKNPAKKQKTAPIPDNTKTTWGGPLPFEKLDFRKTMFSKKTPVSEKSPVVGGDEEEDMEGGFDKNAEEDAPKPLPPWLVQQGDIRADYAAQMERDKQDNAADREVAEEAARRWQRDHGVIDVDAVSQDDGDVEITKEQPRGPIDLTRGDTLLSQTSNVDFPITNENDVALKVRASPPKDTMPDNRQPAMDSMAEQPLDMAADEPIAEPIVDVMPSEPSPPHQIPEDEQVEWSESDHEDYLAKRKTQPATIAQPTAENETMLPPRPPSTERSPSPVFEDVEMPDQGAVFSSTPAATMPPPPATLQPSASEIQRAEEDAYFDDFDDPDDEELLANLAKEAEENARFVSQFNHKTPEQEQADYERELKALRNQQKKDRRDADDVTQTMVQECKALLGFFGLPYITAEGEAEAQCAELVHLGLVDGVVTDDCDVFLFGGTRIYKNLFNSNKFVECYLASDIEKEITLSRQQLINIAQLLGSDYTEGLPGIGPITALEITSEFPGENGLEDFKDWWTHAQAHPSEASKLPAKDFRKKFQKAQGKKLFLPPGFPSPAVKDAYLNPKVDKSNEPFQWGVADLNRLRSFLMETIGWSQERVDEVLVPVIRDMNKRATEGTQSNITRYFEGGVGAGARDRMEAGRMEGTAGSKRMKDAVNRLKARRLGDPGNLSGTWGEEAAEWARKNELSERAEVEKAAERREKAAEKAAETNMKKASAALKAKTKRVGKKKAARPEVQDDDDGDDDGSYGS